MFFLQREEEEEKNASTSHDTTKCMPEGETLLQWLPRSEFFAQFRSLLCRVHIQFFVLRVEEEKKRKKAKPGN